MNRINWISIRSILLILSTLWNHRHEQRDRRDLGEQARAAEFRWIEQVRHWIARRALTGARFKSPARILGTVVRQRHQIAEEVETRNQRLDRAQLPTVAL